MTNETRDMIISEVTNGNLERLHRHTIYDVCENRQARISVRVKGRKRLATIFKVAGKGYILSNDRVTSDFEYIIK